MAAAVTELCDLGVVLLAGLDVVAGEVEVEGDGPITVEEDVGELDGDGDGDEDESVETVPVVVEDSTVLVLELGTAVLANTISGVYGSLTRIAAWAKALEPLLTTLMLYLSEQGFDSAS